MGHVLERVEILILGGNFDAAAPAAGAVKIQTAGIGNRGPVDPELVVVESLVLGTGVSGPDACRVLDQVVFDRADVELNLVRLARSDTGADAALGIDLGVLPAGLIVGRGLEILLRRRRIRLRRTHARSCEQRQPYANMPHFHLTASF